MKLVTLGKSDIRVSRLGMGVWQASDAWKGNDQEIVKAIGKSQEMGVNLVDTAEVYGHGHSEKVVGRALREFGRENFVVATKVYGAHLRYDELQKAARASIGRLGLKEVDLYQVHWPDPWEQIPLKHTMRALEKLYREGKIRAIGVSNFAVRDLEEARSHLSTADIVSNQIRYNLLQREVEEEVIPYCTKEGISILAYSPLAQGALTGKYSSRKVPRGDIRDQNLLFEGQNIKQIEKKITPILSRIAKRRGKTTSQVALAWLIAHPSIIPIPGAKNIAQAEENAGAAGLVLTAEEVREIENASRELKLDYFVED